MPKKTRKMKQRAAMRRAMIDVPQEQVVAGTETEDAPAVETPVRMRPTFSSSRGLSPLTFDYSHIYGDLKRIALFAGFFFIVLIALSFIIK